MSDRIIQIFDTTLRDGEQAAGSRLGLAAKLEIAKQLERLNVDVIEAGFPISSPEDFNAVKSISEQVRKPIICGLTRAVIKDIDVCAEALSGAAKSRIHTGIAVSDLHILWKFKDEKYGRTLEEKRKKIIEIGVEAVAHSKKYTNDVEFYAEDAGRTDPGYLIEVVREVIAAGATVVNIPDTTGYGIPEQFGELIYTLKTKVPNIEKAIISVHCHNDLGLAVANSLAAIRNGAGQVECTINGIGERAGNASLEEIVMALKIRNKLFEADTKINIKELFKTSRMVAESLAIPVPHNKAIIGKNAYAHSSGIHVDGFLKNRETYEIINPQDVGFPESSVILTARTGRHGLKHRLEILGYKFSSEELEQLYNRFLKIADQKQEVTDEDLIAIVNDEISTEEEVYKIESIQCKCGNGTTPLAIVKLSKKGEGTIVRRAKGVGPVDAVYQAINSMIDDFNFKLVDFNIGASSSGTNALAEAVVRVKNDKITVVGKGASTDIVEASAKGYIHAINKLYAMSKQIITKK